MVKERLGRTFAVLSSILVVVMFFTVIRAAVFSEVSEDKTVWIELTFLLLAAVVAQFAVMATGQPSVIILLVMGLLISPKAIELAWPAISSALNFVMHTIFRLAPFSASRVPHFVSYSETVHLFAQLGAIILMFKVGLHSEEKEIFNLRNLVVGALGVAVPFAGGFAYALLTRGGIQQGMFFGVALAATSIGVTVAVLDQYKLLKKSYARIILGAAVVDDILALLLFSLATSFAGGQDITAWLVLSKVATAAIFVSGGLIFGKKLLERVFRNTRGGRRTFLITMCYLLFYSYAAEFIGLSAIVGAFVAGVTLNYHKHVERIIEKMQPLELFFTPIFFISLGMLIDPATLPAAAIPIAILTLIAFATKYVGCGLGALFTGASPKEASYVGIGMIPRGEIALIIALVGLTTLSATGAPLFSPLEYTILSGMTLITTLATPILIQQIICRKESGV